MAELAELEAVTVHDVKAVEYCIGRRLPELGLGTSLPGALRVHLRASNNLSYALGIKDAVEQVWLPAARRSRGRRLPPWRVRPRLCPCFRARTASPPRPRPGQGARGVRAPSGPSGAARGRHQVIGQTSTAPPEPSRPSAAAPDTDWPDVRSFVTAWGWRGIP
ncbi:hypothetical protein QJS66_17510 [Kocuria rhizophila]|nr:hypothetical protein QJS66_17510 [Kocuria rhizophila]